jgi:outer membrane protein TolC
MGTDMTRHRHTLIGLLVVVFASSGATGRAQERLTLSQSIDATLSANPQMVAARAASGEAEQQAPQAQAGFLPRVDFTQSWQRGNQPVFVFGSLLAQRQFAEADFALGPLNNPAALTNWRSALSVEQILFDGGRTRAAVRTASLAAAEAKAGERQTRNDLALAATRAYGQALRAAAERRTADSAVTAAGENVRTAEARRDAGTGTEADVLSMRVHLAQMRSRAIDAASGERIARGDLNRLMNAPLDREWSLEEPAVGAPLQADSTALVERAMRQRPEIEQAAIRLDISRAMQQTARSALLPHVAVQGGYEWNDGERSGPAGSWIAGASMRMSLFSGGANRARIRQASFALRRSEAEQARAEAAVRLELLTAAEQLGAARARQDVGRAAVAQARESQRMIRDRYEAGMAPAADVIRADTAVLDAEAQRINALVDVIVGEAALRRAAGQEVHP